MAEPKTPSTLPGNSAFVTPLDQGRDKDFAPNPYDYHPKAPPRFRESSTDDSEVDFRILPSEKPLSDRIFLDLDFSSSSGGGSSSKRIKTQDDRFVPVSPAPFLKPRKFSIRKPRPSKPTENSIDLSSSEAPQLSVSWIKKRSGRSPVFLQG